MASNLGTEIQNLDEDHLMRDNDKTIRDAVRSVWSRGNLAPSSLAITATGTLDGRYTAFFFNTTGGAITATLQSANYWGVNKTPLLYMQFVTGGSAVTITAAGADTIDGVATKTLSSGSFILYSDGISNWYSFSSGSAVSNPFLIPTVTQDASYAPVTLSATVTAFELNSFFSTSNAAFQQAVLYTGSGVLTQCYLIENTFPVSATAFNASVRITIDGVVVFTNATMLGTKSRYQLVVGSDIYQDVNGVLHSYDAASGWGFKTSCKIEIAGNGASTNAVFWKITKQS